MASSERGEWNTRPRAPRGGAKEWCERYDVHRLLTPFAYRETNAIRVGERLHATIEGLRPTAATFRISDAVDGHPDPAVADLLVGIRGAWQLSTANNPKYTNPDYVHLGSFDHGIVSDDCERVEILRRLADTGVPRLADLAPRFGMTMAELEWFCEREQVGWRERRREGRRRLKRTCMVAVSWGYSVERVARAYSLPVRVVWHWLAGMDSSWVPADPSLGIGCSNTADGRT